MFNENYIESIIYVFVGSARIKPYSWLSKENDFESISYVFVGSARHVQCTSYKIPLVTHLQTSD